MLGDGDGEDDHSELLPGTPLLGDTHHHQLCRTQPAIKNLLHEKISPEKEVTMLLYLFRYIRRVTLKKYIRAVLTKSRKTWVFNYILSQPQLNLNSTQKLGLT